MQVIAKFADDASTTNLFMFHGHFSHHKNGGMMGPFIVYDPTVVTATRAPVFLEQPRSGRARPSEKVRPAAAVSSPQGTTFAWYFRGGEFCHTDAAVLTLHDVTAAYASGSTVSPPTPLVQRRAPRPHSRAIRVSAEQVQLCPRTAPERSRAARFLWDHSGHQPAPASYSKVRFSKKRNVGARDRPIPSVATKLK